MTPLLLAHLCLALATADDDLLAPPTATPVEAAQAQAPPSDGALPGLVQDVLVDHVAAAMARGDAATVAQLADDALPGMTGRRRDAVALAAASVHRPSNPAAALALLDGVAAADGPLASTAALMRAELLLETEAAADAVALCAEVAARWPGSHPADQCDAITAAAAASLGDASRAAEAAASWRRRHPREPLDEAVALRLADRALRHPEHQHDAVEALRALAVDFRSPVTRAVALDLLARHGAAPPDDPASARVEIERLLDAGLAADAWAAWQRLTARDDLDAATRGWIEGNARDVAWRARAWDAVLDHVRADWAATPTSDVAWRGYKSASRGGRFDEAAVWIHEGLTRWGRQRPWRDGHDAFAQVLLLGGHHDDAHALLSPGASTRSAAGRRRALLLALTDLAARRPDEAIDHLDGLAQVPNDQRVAALYWRSRAHLAVAEHAGPAEADAARRRAEADRDLALTLEPDGWYAALLRDAPPHRRGRFAALRAPPAPPTPFAPELPPPPFRPPPTVVDARPPAGYPAGPLFDPLGARRLLADLADQHGARWPDLETAADLARAGLYDLSGPLLAGWYDDLTAAARRRDPSARALLKQLGTNDLVALFAAARDHHDTARLTWARHHGMSHPGDVLASLQLQFPVAHGAAVWEAARAADVDPWLVLALMRSESTYNPLAVSPVGARGPMQIMPRTGHLLAARLGMSRFQTSDLFTPDTAVALGVRYLGLLLDRFDGAWPLAVASYNAGPHNVGAWLDGAGGDVDVPWLVELIPFRETRDYVRRVGGWYDQYSRLYDGEGVWVPPRASAQDPRVVDF